MAPHKTPFFGSIKVLICASPIMEFAMHSTSALSLSQTYTFILSLSLLILSNYCRIPIPGLGAPITLQTMCVITMALLLSPQLASKTLITYFILTLTMFNPHGFLIIPSTIGYLLGMAIAAYIGITLKDKIPSKQLIPIQYCIPLIIGTFVLSLSVGLKTALIIGCYPFIVIECLKAVLTYQVICYLKPKQFI
jgi:biotin transporter BioY